MKPRRRPGLSEVEAGLLDRHGPRVSAALRWLSDNHHLIQACQRFAMQRGRDTAFCASGGMFREWGEILRPAADALDSDVGLSIVGHFMLGPTAHDARDLLLANAGTEMLIWAMRWHQYGRPTVALQPGQAATLAMTDTAGGMADDVRAPWPAFEITIPAEEIVISLGETFSVRGKVADAAGQPMRRIWVSAYQGPAVAAPGNLRGYHAGHWNVYLPFDNGVELHSGVRSIDELISNCEIKSMVSEHAINTMSELENRAVAVAGRIALSTILSIHAHGHRRRGHAEEKTLPKAERRAFRAAKLHDNFVIGTPVVIGLEPEVSEYLTGRIGEMRKSRWCTRGHWRSQPHGPGHALRKPVWIAPHWNSRGPERLREYVLGESVVKRDA